MSTADEVVGLTSAVDESTPAAENATTASTRAALAVYQQYQALSGDVARLQKERLAVEEDTAQVRAQIERLREEQADMEARTAEAHTEGERWRQRLRTLQSGASPTTTGAPTAEAAIAEARRDAANLRLRVQEQRSIVRELRERFQRESRSFRLRGCREASVRAAAAGLPRSVAAHAFLALHGRFDFAARYNTGDTTSEPTPERCETAEAADAQEEGTDGRLSSEGGDPTLWTDLFTGDEEHDEEVRDLLRAYQDAKRQWDHARLDHDEASEDVKAVREKLERRHERRDAVRAQLERVTQEVDDLEARLKALRGRTEKAAAGIGREAPDTRAPPLTAKRARFATSFVSPSPTLQRASHVVNPYAKASAMAGAPTAAPPIRSASTARSALPPSASDALRHRPDVQAAVLGRRGGRRPPNRGRNRDFGCSLVVEDGTDLDTSWRAPAPAERDDTDDGGDLEEAPKECGARSSLTQTLRLLEEDDDEDDRWLLADPWASKK